jgi:hypothetical protein
MSSKWIRSPNLRVLDEVWEEGDVGDLWNPPPVPPVKTRELTGICRRMAAWQLKKGGLAGRGGSGQVDDILAEGSLMPG